jgi:TrpR-related protein YerC/YecD
MIMGDKIYDKFNDVYEAILKLKTVEEVKNFFKDICTINELEAIFQRLEVAKLLVEKKNYQEISRLTGASTATISRVSRCINYGAGGYQLVLGETKENK